MNKYKRIKIKKEKKERNKNNVFKPLKWCHSFSGITPDPW